MADDQGSKSPSVKDTGTTSSYERRRSARIPLEMWVEEITDGHQVFRRAGNVSSGGMYLDQTIPLPVGSTVQLRFTLPGDDTPITVSGTIVSIKKDLALGMGVKFVDVEAAVQARIDAYLTRQPDAT